MRKPWENKRQYEIPRKPRNVNKQVSMVWDYLYNHLPSKLAEQDKRIGWQDVKLNFILVLVALILAYLGMRLFI